MIQNYTYMDVADNSGAKQVHVFSPKDLTAIWFGIMVLMTVGFGLLAPPVGLSVYIVDGMARDVPIGESYRGAMPFLVSDTLRTLLLLFFPAISLWLVKFLK